MVRVKSSPSEKPPDNIGNVGAASSPTRSEQPPESNRNVGAASSPTRSEQPPESNRNVGGASSPNEQPHKSNVILYVIGTLVVVIIFAKFDRLERNLFASVNNTLQQREDLFLERFKSQEQACKNEKKTQRSLDETTCGNRIRAAVSECNSTLTGQHEKALNKQQSEHTARTSKLVEEVKANVTATCTASRAADEKEHNCTLKTLNALHDQHMITKDLESKKECKAKVLYAEDVMRKDAEKKNKTATDAHERKLSQQQKRSNAKLKKKVQEANDKCKDQRKADHAHRVLHDGIQEGRATARCDSYCEGQVQQRQEAEERKCNAYRAEDERQWQDRIENVENRNRMLLESYRSKSPNLMDYLKAVSLTATIMGGSQKFV